MVNEPHRAVEPNTTDSAPSESSLASEYATNLRQSVAEDLRAGSMDRVTANALLGSADFAERTHSIPCDNGAVVSLWGFGDCPVLFEPEDGHGFLTALHYLIEPTGCDYATLRREYGSDVEDGWPGVEQIIWHGNDGELRTLEIVNHQFCMRILGGVSPWASEFNKNMQATFRRAFIESGMAEALGPVTIVDSDGTVRDDLTMTDVITREGELPTEDEAREQAFRGAAGAL